MKLALKFSINKSDCASQVYFEWSEEKLHPFSTISRSLHSNLQSLDHHQGLDPYTTFSHFLDPCTLYLRHFLLLFFGLYLVPKIIELYYSVTFRSFFYPWPCTVHNVFLNFILFRHVLLIFWTLVFRILELYFSVTFFPHFLDLYVHEITLYEKGGDFDQSMPSGLTGPNLSRLAYKREQKCWFLPPPPEQNSNGYLLRK